MKTIFTIMAYCYLGRWLYLEASVLLPNYAPYFQSTLELVDPPTHERIAEIIDSFSKANKVSLDFDSKHSSENDGDAIQELPNDSQEFPEDYF